MADPVYTLGLELAPGSLTNVTSWCLRGSWSRAIADVFEPLAVGDGSFELANDVGSFSTLLNSNLKVGRRIALTAVHGGSAFNLFSGRVKSFSTRPFIGERTTVLGVVTEVDRLSRMTFSTSMFVGFRTASLYTEIMSRCAVQSFAIDSDADDEIPFAWYRDTPSVSAVDALVKSGNYQIYQDGAGTFRMRGRNWDFMASAVATLDTTVPNSAVFDLNDSVGLGSVINKMRAGGLPRGVDTNVATLAYIGSPLQLPSSGGIGFFLNFSDPRNSLTETPVQSIAVQVSSQDFYAAANPDGTGINYTSTLSISLTRFGASVVASIFNGAPACFLTRFQLLGNPVLAGAEIQALTEDSSSQAIYGLVEMSLSDVLIPDRDFLSDYTSEVIRDRKEPRHNESLVLKNDFPGVISFEIGDVLAIINSLSGVNSMWYVRGMSHEVELASGLEHTATYLLEQKPSDRNLLILDHPTRGTLDGTNVLGS